MTGNYDRNFPVTVTEWDNDSDDTEPAKVRDCSLEEFYYDRHRGDLILTFNDDEAERFFDVAVPIKPVSDWNEFVEGLPTWDA
jgi:hypothetical protein